MFVRRRSYAFLLCLILLFLIIYFFFDDNKVALIVPSQIVQNSKSINKNEEYVPESVENEKETKDSKPQLDLQQVEEIPNNVYETDNFEEQDDSLNGETNDDQNEKMNTHFRKWIINAERELIKDEMKTYSFPSTKRFGDFVAEEGGQQVRNMILSTWRSGSNFLAEIIRSVPGTHYNFEPLVEFGSVQINGGSGTLEALKCIRNVLNCDYNNLTHSNKGENLFYHWILGRNTKLWNLCVDNRKACMEPNFLSSICKLHPFQIVKTVRLTLKPAKELLTDPSLNVKLLLLVRDPRAVMLSRSRLSWCHNHAVCDDSKVLCTDLVQNYHETLELIKKYPDKFMALRYEDIVLNVYSATRKILNFFGLQFHPQVTAFLEVHTKSSKGGAYSTYRNSQMSPFKWIKEMAAHDLSKVEEIQNICDEALQVWGYNKIDIRNELNNFNPVGQPPLPEMLIHQDSP